MSQESEPTAIQQSYSGKITMSWIRMHKDEPEYFVIKVGEHPLELPPKRRDWHLTHFQASAILLLAMGALTALVIWLIVSYSQL
jgi:hypothetical protein